MALNIDYITYLVNIMDLGTFDEELFNRFIKTKALKEFINHENAMGRSTHVFDIKDELIRLLKYENYEDKYSFYILKRNISRLKKDIEYFSKKAEYIIQLALDRVYSVISKDIEVKTHIYLYAAGIDGGFTVKRRQIYINFLNYIGEMDEFIKVLSHELYHSREIPLKNKLKFRLHITSNRKAYAYGILGRIIEEGIACLVQHGPVLLKDDITGNLTRRSLFHTQYYFNRINKALLNIKHGKLKRSDINRINIYAIGYTIVTVVYREKGFLLDQWTVDLNFENIIKEYMNISKLKSNLPKIDEESILWIL